jgi:hypothetical protein
MLQCIIIFLYCRIVYNTIQYNTLRCVDALFCRLIDEFELNTPRTLIGSECQAMDC